MRKATLLTPLLLLLPLAGELYSQGGLDPSPFDLLQRNGLYLPDSVPIEPEDFLSRHSLAPTESDCGEQLCVELGYAYATALDNGEPALFVNLGLPSRLDRTGIEKPNLQLAVVVDRSVGSDPQSLTGLKEGLAALVGQLSEQDTVLLSWFGESAEVALSWTAAGEQDRLLAAIDEITPASSGDATEALSQAYELLDSLPHHWNYRKRVLLLTGTDPAEGASVPTSFMDLTRRYADHRHIIGPTVIGVGTILGDSVTSHLDSLKDGNSFSVPNAADLAALFRKEFRYMVTPIAQDLHVQVTTPPGLKLTQVVGHPAWGPGDSDAVLRFATLFRSSSNHAIILRYEPKADEPLEIAPNALRLRAELSYRNPSAYFESGEMMTGIMTPRRLTPGLHHFSDDRIGKAVALLNLYYGIREAREHLGAGDSVAAIEALARTQTLLSDEAYQDVVAELDEEIRLVSSLARRLAE